MQDWIGYISVFILFFVSHSIPVRPGIKARISDLLGARGFTICYSLLSTFMLILLIRAAGRAPYIPLWEWQEWHNHLAMSIMLIAMLLFALAIGRPNPLSFGGVGNDRFDPQDPGIIGWSHHPLLLVLFLWSSAHLLANGDLAHALMFGCFAGFSLIGRVLINRRKRRVLGVETWARLTATRRRITPSLNGAMRLALGVALYLLVLWAHEPVIGISPLP